jgi:hypothetical protein
MTTSEFKAWFEGYTENIAKVPTQKQWARIKERVLELTKSEDLQMVIYNDYLCRPWWPQWTYTTCGNSLTLALGGSTSADTATYSNTSALFSRCALQLSGSPEVEEACGATFAADMAHEIGRDEAAQDAG